MALRVELDATRQPRRVVIVDPVTTTRVGAIGGIPDLQRLIDCLAAGVRYDAMVTAVDGGRVDVHIQRRDG